VSTRGSPRNVAEGSRVPSASAQPERVPSSVHGDE
jgi:hypothetical protein